MGRQTMSACSASRRNTVTTASSTSSWRLAARAGGWMTLAARRAAAPLGMTVLLLAVAGCDRGIDIVRERFMRRSRATIDSLSAQNSSLQRQMITFERISAEKDTLLREVRDAHILIEAVAAQ